MKIAAVDLGTNAFRVLIKEKHRKSYSNILKYRENTMLRESPTIG